MQKFSFQLSADPEKESNFWTCRDASVTRKATKILLLLLLLLLLLFYESRQRKKPRQFMTILGDHKAVHFVRQG